MNYAIEVLEKELDIFIKLRTDYDNGKVVNKQYDQKLTKRIKELSNAISKLK